MRLALAQAQRGLGRTSPNPAVGTVLVTNGKVVAKGHHERAGEPHAEIACLAGSAHLNANSTLYVTLEPCSTTGRTGPCTTAIINAGVRHVVIGAIDPNPKHRGRGLALLTKAGLNCRSGILAEECAALNVAYNKWITTRRPYVIAKCAMSLDGRIATRPGEPRWITNASSRRHAHQLRAQVDAIMIGAETLRADNPRLTVRGIKGARQPWRTVLSSSGKLPRAAHLFTDRFAARTIVLRTHSLEEALAELGKREILSVLIEGGGQLLGEALDAQLIDRLEMFIAPLFLGGPVAAFAGKGAPATELAARLHNITYRRFEDDLLLSATPTFPPPN